MTALTFEEWLTEFDRDMVKADRKVCLLLDNCSAHNVDTDSLKETELIFLPPNTTSVIQPLDQGIIRNFKHYYRKRVLSKLLNHMDSDMNLTVRDAAKNISILDAVYYTASAWNQVGVETIQNCFFRGLTPEVDTANFKGFSLDEIPVSIDQKAYEAYVDIDDSLETEGQLTDMEICQELKEAENNDEKSKDDGEEMIEKVSNQDVIHALDIIRSRVLEQGIDPNTFYQMESQLMKSMTQNVAQQTINKFFKKL